MQDSADKLMAVWLNLPSRMESFTPFEIKNYEMDNELKQPALKGIAKTESGDEVPFMCMRVHVIKTNFADDDENHQIGIINAFRMDGKWQSSITTGNKPSFKQHETSDTILKNIPKLFHKGGFHTPSMHVHAA